MGKTSSEIHRIALAEALRAHRELTIDVESRIDPFEALRRSGVLVMRQPLDKLSGVYLPGTSTSGGVPGVLINVSHPISRQRFSAAHELWHHRRDSKIVLDTEDGSAAQGNFMNSDRERLAESFASWFLMPKRLVLSTIAKLKTDIPLADPRTVYSLSLALGTSYTATARHLGALNFITQPQLTRLLATTPIQIKRSLGYLDLAMDSRRDIRLVSSNSGDRTVIVLQGDVLVIEVAEIPSSGFAWRCASNFRIGQLIRQERLVSSPEVIGGTILHRFVILAQSSGSERIRLELVRPWAPDHQEEVRDLELVIEESPASGIVHPDVLIGFAA